VARVCILWKAPETGAAGDSLDLGSDRELWFVFFFYLFLPVFYRPALRKMRKDSHCGIVDGVAEYPTPPDSLMLRLLRCVVTWLCLSLRRETLYSVMVPHLADSSSQIPIDRVARGFTEVCIYRFTSRVIHPPLWDVRDLMALEHRP
jgi:hypothetical protein